MLPERVRQPDNNAESAARLKAGKIVFAVICAAVVLLAAGSALYALFGARSYGSPPAAAPQLFRDRYIAVLYIEGVIENQNRSYDQQWLLHTIELLAADTKNAALLLYIDSPGGGVYQADEVYLALKTYAEKKHVWAYLGSVAASGGYYIAAACDYIVANRNTLTGSIGVIAGQALDLTELMDRCGIEMTTVTAGRNKNMMNINEPFTAEQREIMQSIADECYEQFVGIVAESRGMAAEDVRALADGRVYTARQALDNGLIDEIASFDETVDSLRELISGSVSVEEFFVEWRPSLYDYLSGMAAALRAEPERTVLQKLQKSADLPFPAYYWNGF